MKSKRKPRREREFILYENSFLYTLNREQRRQLNHKKPIIYPPIQFIENVRHGVGRRKAFFEFTNTVDIPHWSELVKIDLLGKITTLDYNVLTRIPINSIFDVPEAKQVKMKKQALAAAKMIDAEAYTLKNLPSILQKDNDPLFDLCENHEDISDTELLREFNRANRKASKNDRRPYVPMVVGKNSKRVCEIRKFLKEHKEMRKIGTLTKAADWVEDTFRLGLHPLELVFGVLDDRKVISVTNVERQQIFDRYENQNEPDFDVFAPYTACAFRLYLTMVIFLKENTQNTLKREVLRDYDYLYYMLCDNVSFVSADKEHRKFIDEIPVLNSVRHRFIYFDKRNEKAMKEVLKKLGIKDLTIPKVQ